MVVDNHEQTAQTSGMGRISSYRGGNAVVG
jgi:hypothetical protein